MSTATVFDSRIASDSRVTILIAAAVVLLLVAGLLYTASELYEDLLLAPLHSGLPYLLLGGRAASCLLGLPRRAVCKGLLCRE